MQRAEQAATLDAVRLVVAEPGPALCEDLAICYWAKKPMEVDLFNFRQGVLAGTKSLSALQARVASGYYSTAEFDTTPPSVVIRELRSTFKDRYSMVRLPHGIADVYLK